MYRKWKKKISIILASTLLMTLWPLGRIESAPVVSDNSSPTIQMDHSNNIPLFPLPNVISSNSSNVEQKFIVTFKDKVDKSVIQKFKGKIKREHKHLPSLAVSLPTSEVENLKKNALVQSVEPDIQLKVTAQTMDWGVTAVEATYAWDNGYTGKGVKVAVLDTGIDTHHDDLAVAGGASFVDYTTSYDDDNGHGTHVAGIIGAKNNDIGVVGVAPDASLYAVKVLDQTGTGYLSDVISGIDWAIDNQMDIINLSMTTVVDSTALHEAVDKAYSNGLLVVAAAGNTGNAEGSGDTIQYPAKYSSVISVGAVNQNEQRASFSATGAELEVVAAGVSIKSTYLNNSYAALSGTSMAVPFVAGELALLKQQNPTAGNENLREILDTHVLDLGETGRDAVFGFGSVNWLGYTAINNQVNDPGLDVSSSVYGNVYLTASTTQNYVAWKAGNRSNPTKLMFPSISDAKSITIDGNDTYVLHANNTVTVCSSCFSSSSAQPDSRWPSLSNAKSIAVLNPGDLSGTGNYSVYFYILDFNNKITRAEVKYTRYYVSGTTLTDDTANWPSLADVKAIAMTKAGRYILKTNNTVIYRDNSNVTMDITSSFPSLVNARSFALQYNSDSTGTFVDYYAGYLDLNPSINVSSNTNQTIYKTSTQNTITLSGTVSDLNNDIVTVSASIGGATKSAVVSNTINPQTWTLQWNVDSDNIPVGLYGNIVINASDGVWGTASASYTGTIAVDRYPNVPINQSPGSTNSSGPTMISSETPVLNWTFSDPDTGDVQTKYEVILTDSTGNSNIYDSGWINSSVNSFTVPASVMVRGGTYGWKIRVQDNYGAASDFSPTYFIKINTLPTLTISSYADGQQLTDNVVTLTWAYSDSDGQAQSAYHIQGSKDNWATVGYDSGVLTGATTSFNTPALADGTWGFKIWVNDGMEWSLPFLRNNLVIPNAYEPNDTNETAFMINYNTSYTSLINSSTDVDFFKYVAPNTGVDRFVLNVPSGLNYDVFIYDSNMNLIAAGVKGTGVAENVLYEVTSGDMYYIKIVGVSGNFSTTESYTIIVNKLTIQFQSSYQFDSNGNITSKTTTKTN
jgi:subtilisin family serine protease